MKSFTIISFVCAMASGCDAAFNLVKPKGISPIEFGLIRSETPKLRKRDTIGLDMTTRFEGFEYLVNMTVGTPPQSITAIFDTGSSDLILNSATSDYCTSADPSPCLGGAFDVDSSNATKVGEGMVDQYEVAGYEGNWYTDTVSFAGKSVEDFVFGVADTFSNSTSNIFGVSFFMIAEARGGTAPPTNDSSLAQMVKAGIIPSSAYSVWMDRNSSLGGSITLGGVDTSKFVGELHTYPVNTYPGTNIYLSLELNITSVSVGGSQPVSGNSSDFPARATVDTGNPNLLLPTGLVSNIYSTFGVKDLSIPGGASFGVCECSLANSSATLDVSLSSLKISIPFSDLVVNPTDELYAGYNIPEDTHLPEGTCLFMVSPTRAGFGNILGDNFLRYAYYVVDLDNKQIGLATANPTPGKSQILEISAGSNPLPSFSASGTAATPTGSGTGSGSPTGTGSSPSSTTTKPSSGNRLNSVSVLVVLGLVGLCFVL